MIKFSNTRASYARGCWQKYKFRYMDGLQPRRKAIPLTLGSIEHDAFDKYYKGASNNEVVDFICKEFDNAIAELPYPDQENLREAKYIALGMWRGYPHKDLNEFESIESEVEDTVELAPGIQFNFRVDGRVKKDGRLWLREMKCTGLSQRQFEGRARTSAQATGYTWGAKQLGYDVAGVMYDCLRKPRLRKRKDETIHDFGKRIIMDYSDPKRKESYYGRHFSYRNPVELEQWKVSMIEIAKETQRKMRDDSWYRNYDQCWNFNTECPYLKICHQPKPDNLTLQLYFTTREEREKENKRR